MKRQILIPLDSSPVGREVIHLAESWGKMYDAQLNFLQVNPVQRNHEDQSLLESVLASEKITAEYRAIASFGNPAQEIIEQEKVLKPWMIMMAAHSHSMMSRILLGSNTDYVVNLCKSNLFVYKRSAQDLKDLILVPVDYSKINQKVIRFCDELAQKLGWSLHFLHVFSFPEFAHYNMETGWEWDALESEREKEAEARKLESFLADFGLASSYKQEVLMGKPYEQILYRQEKLNARLIALAPNKHGLVEQLLVGSNTKYVMHHANCSVLIIKNLEG